MSSCTSNPECSSHHHLYSAHAATNFYLVVDVVTVDTNSRHAFEFGYPEKECDNKMKALFHLDSKKVKLNDMMPSYQPLIKQTFRGVEAVFTKFPHAECCQSIVIGFVHVFRAVVFGTPAFSLAMSDVPRQSSHELLMATIDGRDSKWTNGNQSEYNYVGRRRNCTGCNSHVDNGQDWVMSPSMAEYSTEDDLGVNSLWRQFMLQ